MHGLYVVKLLSSRRVAGSFSSCKTSGNMRSVDIVYEHEDLICLRREPVFLLWWRRTPTLPQVTIALEHVQAAGKSMAGGVIVVVVTGEDVAPPDRAANDLFSRTVRQMERQLLAHAFILEGTGLKAAAIRTAIRAMQTMSRVIFPWTIAPTLDEGLLFLAKKTGFITEPEAREIIAEFARIRASRTAQKKA